MAIIRRHGANEHVSALRSVNSLTRSTRGADVSTLSARELAVLRLMAMGRTNLAIGIEPCISLNTVKYHTNNVFQKLQVTSRSRISQCRSRSWFRRCRRRTNA